MTREEIDNYGNMLMAIRNHFDDDYIVISIGARGPNLDCRKGNMVATVRNGNDEETVEAVSLYDAIFMAKGRIDRKREEKKNAKPDKANQD